MTDTFTSEDILTITFLEEDPERKCEGYGGECPRVAVWDLQIVCCQCHFYLCDPCTDFQSKTDEDADYTKSFYTCRKCYRPDTLGKNVITRL